MKILVSVVGVAFLSLAVIHVRHSGGGMPLEDPPHPLPCAPYDRTIAASGVVEPAGGAIEVGTPVAGLVAEVFVTAGQELKQNAPLFRLDDRQLQATLASCKAAVSVARARLTQLESAARDEDVAEVRARLQEAEALLADRQDDLQRAEGLFANRAIPKAELEQSRTQVKVAQAVLDRAGAQLRRLLAGPTSEERAVAAAQVAEAEAQQSLLEVEIERLTVRSPYDALVLRVNVRATESLSVAMPEPPVVLARNGDLYLRVDVAEHQLARYSPRGEAQAVPPGGTGDARPLQFVRIEPYCLARPPRNGPVDDVDARVVQVLYRIDGSAAGSLYVGQQLDVFLAARGPEGP